MQEAFDDLAIPGRLPTELTASVTNQCAIAHLKLIAFRVAAKIIVIVQDEDACVWVSLSIKMRRRKTADATAYDNQVINRFIGLLNEAPICSALTPKRVRNLEGPIVIAPHARQSGWIGSTHFGSGLSTAEQ